MLLLALSFMHPVSLPPSLDYDRLVAVICHLENGRWTKPGGAGNMMRSTWGDYTKLSYSFSGEPKHALPVYFAHLRKLERGLIAAKVDVNPGSMYLAWWRGLSGALPLIRSERPPEIWFRANNLYFER